MTNTKNIKIGKKCLKSSRTRTRCLGVCSWEKCHSILIRDCPDYWESPKYEGRPLLEVCEVKSTGFPAIISTMCLFCGEPKTSPLFCSDECKKESMRLLKEAVYKHKSMGCARCGYDEYSGALAFHHLTGKSIEVGDMKYIHEFVAECKKNPMVVLCANCHRLIHAGVESDVCLADHRVAA